MKKELKYYLHLYGIGTVVYFDRQTWVIIELHTNTVKAIRTDNSHSNEFYYEDCAPKLRSLNDMTEVEKKQMRLITQEHTLNSGDLLIAKKTMFLLSKQFDLFNLIPEGLAVDMNEGDKTSINQQTYINNLFKNK